MSFFNQFLDKRESMMIHDKDKGPLIAAIELRRHAEVRIGSKTAESPPLRSEVAKQKLVQELEVHQIELEMQNEELLRSQEELELSRSNYNELYDFAPVSYFTFDAAGVIREVNLTGTQLLGMERVLLVEKPFIGFIADAAGRDVFLRHLESVRLRQGLQGCDLKLTGKDGALIHAQLKSVMVDSVENRDGFILSSIVDATLGMKLGEDLQKAHGKLEQIKNDQARELSRSSMPLTLEITERKRAEESLQSAYAGMKLLKDQLQAENIYLQQEIAKEYNFGEIIGKSKELSYLFLRMEQLAPMNATVLLLGETGTGKGVVARAIHSGSARKDRPMITVDCTALPANLIESELFGWERGALTGAASRQIGRLELANGGTIFLDEIGELPMELQCKLLRVIQDGEFERLGSPRTIKIDVRVIAASNRNLEDMFRHGRFREDLFYRLNVFPITIPPLRQRKEDIPLLVSHFIAKFNKKVGKNVETVSSESLNALQQYHWPGNVRELETVIERAVITSPGAELQILDRFDTFRRKGELVGQEVKALVELEHDHIIHVLQKTAWRIEGKDGAAALLGLNPSTLRARMRKYGIIRL